MPTWHTECTHLCCCSTQNFHESPRLAHSWCHLCNIGSAEEWEYRDTEMWELVSRKIICDDFTAGGIYTGCSLLTLHCFNSQSRRLGCYSNLQYSWPPYISMLLKYQGTNDMWHQWKTRKLRPTFLAYLLLLYPLEEQLVNELSCDSKYCKSASPSFWILLYVRGNFAGFTAGLLSY